MFFANMFLKLDNNTKNETVTRKKDNKVKIKQK